MQKISWIMLTYNRFDVVNRSFTHNILQCGLSLSNLNNLNIIWVDNGSIDLPVDVGSLAALASLYIINRTNLGVARGYNQGIGLATGDFIVVTGCDRLMPDNWLKMALESFEKIENTGVISFYSHPMEKVKERQRGEIKIQNGVEIQECMPIEAKILRRSFHRSVGYLKEDLGLYGWEDVLWGERAEKVAKDLGLINYTFPEMIAKHLGDEGVNEWKGGDDKAYHEFKRRESTDPNKKIVCEEYRKAGHPYFNPYV